MENMKLSPPWETYWNEIRILFDGDPDVRAEKDYGDEKKNGVYFCTRLI